MRKIFIIFLVALVSLTSFAEKGTKLEQQRLFAGLNNSEFDIRFDKNRKRNLWIPMASLLFPGFGQALEGQYDWALGYGTIGATGLIGGMSLTPHRNKYSVEQDMLVRAYLTAGSFSAYHDFRTAIRTRKDSFYFIKKEDSIKDILEAPFDFKHLKNPSVNIPLAIAGLALIGKFSNNDKPTYKASLPRRAAFTFGTSYMAGTGEEVLFRGYALPALQAGLGDNFWVANGLQALAFGAIHPFRGRSFPFFESAFGFYFGWLAREEGYSLAPGIFLNHWWDVLILGAELLNPNGITKEVSVDLFNIRF